MLFYYTSLFLYPIVINVSLQVTTPLTAIDVYNHQRSQMRDFRFGDTEYNVLC